MLKRVALPLFLAPALLLGGCGTYNGGLDSVYQPVVQRSDYALDLRTSGYSLAPGEAARLADWFASLNVHYGDKIAIDDGADGRTGRDEVAAAASHYGLLLADRAPVSVGRPNAGSIRVVITRTTASVPNCPDYSRIYTPDYKESTSSNFGCATNTNLAAMVADPADLVRGEPGSPTSDTHVAAKAISAMRNAQPTGAGGTQIKPDSPGGGSK